MKKHHALALSLLLAVATVAGVVALTRTVALGQETPTTSTSELDRREAALDRARRQIARLDASIPPALPPAARTAASPTTRVVVVQAAASASAPEDREDDDGWEHEHEEQEHEGAEAWDD